MMNLIIQLTAQLKEMEIAMDKLVQEKQAGMEVVPITAIPIAFTSTPLPTTTPVSTKVPETTLATTSVVPTTQQIDQGNAGYVNSNY